MRSTTRDLGFTLVELLLAVAITAVVMVTVTMTFRITLEAREAIADLGESTEAGPRILNLIERDLRGLWTFNVHNNAVFRGRNMDVGSFEADRMDFLTTTDAAGFVLDPQNRQLRPSVCEVGYWFKQHPRYRDLIELWRREDPMVDDDLLQGGSFQLVHDRIKSFKVTYYRSLGHESEELQEWDSTQEDKLPRRLKIEFTLERERSSRNLGGAAEVEDLEGVEKTYVRHIVFDRRYETILAANQTLIPVRPPKPEAQGSGGPAGPGAEGGRGGPAGAGGPAGEGGITMMGEGGRGQGQGGRRGGDGSRGIPGGKGDGVDVSAGRGNFNPGALPQPGRGAGTPPFNLGDLLRGGGQGGGGLGGLFGGQGGGR